MSGRLRLSNCGRFRKYGWDEYLNLQRAEQQDESRKCSALPVWPVDGEQAKPDCRCGNGSDFICFHA
jgi:hypothetical protein